MRGVTLILRLATLALVLLILLQIRRAASRNDVAGLRRLVQLGRAKALVEDIDRVRPGATKSEVLSIVGRADNPEESEWIYYLEDDSGYIITFDASDRVREVKSWKA